jgi:exonuclease III
MNDNNLKIITINISKFNICKIIYMILKFEYDVYLLQELHISSEEIIKIKKLNNILNNIGYMLGYEENLNLDKINIINIFKIKNNIQVIENRYLNERILESKLIFNNKKIKIINIYGVSGSDLHLNEEMKKIYKYLENITNTDETDIFRNIIIAGDYNCTYKFYHRSSFKNNINKYHNINQNLHHILHNNEFIDTYQYANKAQIDEDIQN